MERVSGAAGASNWDVAWDLPGPAAGRGVHRYHGFRMDLASPRRRLELPAVIATLVVLFDGELSVAAAGRAGAVAGRGGGEARSRKPFRALLCGPQTRAHIGQHGGRLAGIDVTMEPWAGHALFGVAMHEITDRAVDLTDTLGPDHRTLIERLGAARGWRARFDAVDDFLGTRRARGPAPAAQVVEACTLLRGSGGTMPIARVAASVGWDQRRLQRAFATQVGVRPKAAARILRLQRALRLLAFGVAPSLVAYECSYFDQAHLTNDITELTGRSPRRLLAERAAMPVGPPNVDRLSGEVTSIIVDTAVDTTAPLSVFSKTMPSGSGTVGDCRRRSLLTEGR